MIVESEGVSIERIFAERGEDEFRRIERETLARVAADDRQVVSTGGGLPMDARNREVMERSGIVALLEARPETLMRRLELERAEEGDDLVERPMLDAADDSTALVERIQSLKAERQYNYTLAHWTVHTDLLTPAQAAEEVVRGFRMVNDAAGSRGATQTLGEATGVSAGLDAPGRPAPSGGDPELAAEVRTSQGDYPLWVGWGAIDEVGERVGRMMQPDAAYIVTDEGVYDHARRAQNSLERAGIAAHLFVIPPGEQNKTLATAQHIYTWLAELKAERGHLILAVGGGVVGDLAGFVAATYLRGLPLAQVPTSLLAMMDAAIGGKTAVDLPQGKNLVGAFYQPKFVLADVSTLRSLPERELNSGWAEALKHGLILDEGLLSTFENHTAEIRALEPETTTDVIRRSMAVKANVVSQDERETLGIRVLLNYGHTIGHGIEQATGYGQYLHGEAVSVGMMGAARIGRGMGLMSNAEVERQREALAAYGLPLAAPGVDADDVSEAMRSDKKVASGNIRWVLLDGIGNATTRNDVPTELVSETLRGLMGKPNA